MQQRRCPSRIDVKDDGWFYPSISEKAERISRLAALGIMIDGYRHRDLYLQLDRPAGLGFLR